MNTYGYASESPLSKYDVFGLNPWNDFQREVGGNRHSGPEIQSGYRQKKLDDLGVKSRRNVQGGKSGRGSAADYLTKACQYKSDNEARLVIAQIRVFIENTSSCEMVYWQVDFKAWPTGCNTDYTLYIKTDTSVYHGIHQAEGGFWTFDRGSAPGSM